MKHAVLALALLSASAAFGQVRPQPGPGDPRLQTVDYKADQVVQLQAAPGYQLSVEFAPDERIESVAVGDSSAWQVTANRRGDRLFIKPAQNGGSTNLTVVTDARTYLFDLTPLGMVGPDTAYSVRFRYPQAAAAEQPPAIAAIETRYVLSGARALRPRAISDDGVHTFIEWPPEATLPAIYAVDGQGREALVNGAMRDGIFVIDSVAPRLLFRIDRSSAQAVRKPARKKRR